ncbi:hypothetical protein GMOD_00006122 [Pyrenophora seminiperda CCB06]|uniref:Uncharacterized protein n=1 Tax=Pyrenophora seminiperda CCB06 TaxID=1302712 RepID=A0A3M7M4B0_9PLEO|nr:hypothetical protein GMOD_00006122 [Pyrenophora seminiperda CCB06]
MTKMAADPWGKGQQRLYLKKWFMRKTVIRVSPRLPRQSVSLRLQTRLFNRGELS